jgi:hypothetical protein
LSTLEIIFAVDLDSSRYVVAAEPLPIAAVVALRLPLALSSRHGTQALARSLGLVIVALM